MGWYRYINHGDVVKEGFPKITKSFLQSVERHFQEYIFYETTKEGRRLWTSCCGKDGMQYDKLRRTVTPEEQEIFYAQHNDTAHCPFCGRSAIVKNIGRTSSRQKLDQYFPIVYLKSVDNMLYAQCFWAHRDFTASMTPVTMYKPTTFYRFKKGNATAYESDYSCEEKSKLVWYEIYEDSYYAGGHGRRLIKEPFTKASGMFQMYCPYEVYGLDEIANSDFKYCQYSTFRKSHPLSDPATHEVLMKYLTAAALYPRQIEMLVKIGKLSLVDDLVYSRRKNNDIIRWGIDDPAAAFGLTAQELKDFLNLKIEKAGYRDYTITVLRNLKKFKRAKMQISFNDAALYSNEFDLSITDFIDVCRDHHLKPQKAYRYIEKDTRWMCGGMGYRGAIQVLKDWRDYISAARFIGYDLAVETVLMPRDLMGAHDAAVAEQARRQTAADLKSIKAARRTAKGLLKKYSFAMDGYCIRPALSGEEIVAEGNRLEHCVGTYAERHMSGKITICFLRKIIEPDKPLVTIELNLKGELVQARGYRNDARGTPAKKTYDFILSPWLGWIAAGSKRDKDGNPIIKTKVRKSA